MHDADGKLHSGGVQSVEAAPGELRPVEFRVAELQPGTHQGYVRIVGQDGLAADDTRYFTVEVKPAWRVLLAAPRRRSPPKAMPRISPRRWRRRSYRKRGQARFDCDVCDLADLPKRPLGRLCRRVPVGSDAAGAGHVAEAGRLCGRRARRGDLPRAETPRPSIRSTSPQAQALLPGKLLRQARRPDGDLYLAPRDFQHPILAAFRSQASSIPWDAFPVFRYWELRSAVEGRRRRGAVQRRKAGVARTARGPRARADDDHARLRSAQSRPVEPAAGRRPGRRAVALRDSGRTRWRPTWSAAASEQLNYLAGQTAVRAARCRPAAPRLSAVHAGRAEFFLLGQSRTAASCRSPRPIKSATTGSKRAAQEGVNLGFSVNYAPDQTRLDRLSDQELAAMFGPLKFQLAHTREQIDRDISAGRVGRELFPPLILMVAIVLALEMLVANRFYRE